MSHFYVATVRNHLGEVVQFDSRYYKMQGSDATPGPKVMTKRIARTYGRALARHCGLRGKLVTTVVRCAGKASNVVQLRDYQREVVEDVCKAAAESIRATVERRDDEGFTRPRYHVIVGGESVKAYKIKKEAQAHADGYNAENNNG